MCCSHVCYENILTVGFTLGIEDLSLVFQSTLKLAGPPFTLYSCLAGCWLRTFQKAYCVKVRQQDVLNRMYSLSEKFHGRCGQKLLETGCTPCLAGVALAPQITVHLYSVMGFWCTTVAHIFISFYIKFVCLFFIFVL